VNLTPLKSQSKFKFFVKRERFNFHFFLPKSTGCFFHVVLESTQIHPLHCLAQLQMENHQGNNFSLLRVYDPAFLLLDSRLHSEKAYRSLKLRQPILHDEDLLKVKKLIYLTTTAQICSREVSMGRFIHLQRTRIC